MSLELYFSDNDIINGLDSLVEIGFQKMKKLSTLVIDM
jgi:hypothetical protein